MIRILLLCFALLLSSIASTKPAEAARPSAYARAKMKGRIFTHRPVYKKYKGWKHSKRQRRSKAGKLKRAKAAPRILRVSHNTTRF